jgi:hypothetical protein
MADDADRAQVEIEAELAHARLAARAQFRLVATGHCHNCEQRLERPGQLFCDQECARDYELRERARAWQGD